jgi:predicted  nucleic acid-binding Zn-ribbon protein
MSFRDIQNTQKEHIEKHILKLLNLLNQTENKFNLAQLPTERENYQMEIVQIKSNIENYKQELKDLEDEIKETTEPSRSRQVPLLRNYRVSLDYSLPDEEINVTFHEEVEDVLDLMGYEIEDVHISGATPTTFLAVQEGDFDISQTESLWA